MSIIITNITESHIPVGINQYVVRINHKVICHFDHDRKLGGLANCLRDAASAVDALESRKEEPVSQAEIDDLVKKLVDWRKRQLNGGGAR